MAPEQIEGTEIDARSDIFAFGAVVYEMATGRKAFEGKSQASLIAAILNRDPPSLTTLQPLAPVGLDRLVRQCLAKEPERRWHCAHDLATELKWILEGVRVADSNIRSLEAGRKRIMLAAAVALLAGAVLAALAIWPFVGGRAGSSKQVVRATIGLPEGEFYYREGNRVMAVAVEGSAGRFKMSTPRPLFETSDTGPEDVMPDGRILMIQSPQPDRPRELNLVLNWSAALRQR